MTHERRLDDARGMQLAANLYLNARRGCSLHGRESDGTIQGWGKGTARYFAGGHYFLMAAQHPALFEHEADEFRIGSAPQVLERLAPDEIAVGGFEGHRPSQPRLQRVM